MPRLLRHSRPLVPAADEGPEASCQRGFVLTSAFFGILFILSLGTHAFGLLSGRFNGQSEAYAALWPQGWSFFSDAADTRTIDSFQVFGDGRSFAPAASLHMSAEDDWGLGRIAYAQSGEAFALAHRIPANAWVACPGASLGDCLPATPPVRVTDDFDPPLLCGTIAFVWSAPGQPVEVAGGTAKVHGSVAWAQVLCPA